MAAGADVGGAAHSDFPQVFDCLAGSVCDCAAVARGSQRAELEKAISARVGGGNRVLVRGLLLDPVCPGVSWRSWGFGGMGGIPAVRVSQGTASGRVCNLCRDADAEMVGHSHG